MILQKTREIRFPDFQLPSLCEIWKAVAGGANLDLDDYGC